jgi:hypothetical protein
MLLKVNENLGDSLNIRKPLMMKISNHPSSPFRKGGLGGFESYFLRNQESDSSFWRFLRLTTHIQFH